jgi:hypothetical protein
LLLFSPGCASPGFEAIGAGCQHCGADATELHHWRPKRGSHQVPSTIWRRAGPSESEARRAWDRAHRAVIALCTPCHDWMHCVQGPTRATKLPFDLRWTDRGWQREGACACERCV